MKKKIKPKIMSQSDQMDLELRSPIITTTTTTTTAASANSGYYDQYGAPVRLIPTDKPTTTKWNRKQQYHLGGGGGSGMYSRLSIHWISNYCKYLLPFPLRKLLTRGIRFIFLVVLMVTVIINILFIIDTRNRLQSQQQQQQSKQTVVQTNDGKDSHLSLMENDHSGEPRRSIKIEIVSSQTRVTVTIDGSIILDDSEEGKNRGIHILVLNQMTGSIMARRHFDTYSPHEDEAMSLFISMVSEERILIVAIKDEGTFQLKKAARDLLTRIGSRRAQQLGWRDMWAMVVQKRLLTKSSALLLPNSQSTNSLLGEAYSKSTGFNFWATPAILRVEVELLPESEIDCQWFQVTTPSNVLGKLFSNIFSLANEQETDSDTTISSIDFNIKSASGSIFLPDDDETQARRRHFCSRIEGYGSVCSCTDPLPLRFVLNYDKLSAISQVPIAIIASNRPHYLYRMLRTLLSTSGCNPSMITVFIDGYYEEPLEVAKLFGLRGIQHTPIGTKNARISQHYKASLTATFNLYPDAQYAIILEEDLDVSPDFFRYFAQTMHLLDEDDSLFCISAWNDQAYEHTSDDTSLLYRVETMPGLGWMLRRKLYKEELESRWPPPDKLWDWDMWMRLPDVRRDRECIVPDVSRTFHFGSSGLNMNSYFQDVYFKKHAFNTDPSARLANVNMLKRKSYERLLTKLIRLAVIVDHSKGPCDSNFLKPSSAFRGDSHFRNKLAIASPSQIDTSNLYLIFIRMVHSQDFNSWLLMAKCLHVWDLDARGFHRGLWRLYYNGAHLIVIGAPFSPYSAFKPPHIVPISLSKTTTNNAAMINYNKIKLN